MQDSLGINRNNNISSIKQLKEAIESGFDTEFNHLMLAKLYRKEGQTSLSIKEFEKVIEISPCKDELFFKNKILNEIEITQRKTILESKPRGMGVTLTTRCNLSCFMCDSWKGDWDIPEKTVREIMELMPYLQQIFWQGGEVFLSDYFELLFDKASYYPNLRQVIVTNGILINEKWAKKLVRSKVSLNYSIDAVTKDTYEYIRRGAKFKDVLESINIVNEYRERYRYEGKASDKFTTIMNVVVMKSNYHQLTRFVDFTKKYKFDDLLLSSVRNITDSENIFLNRNLEAADYIEKNMPEVLQKAKDYGITLYNMLPSIDDSISAIKQDSSKEEKLANCPHITVDGLLCSWPFQQLFIESGGRVRPNCFCPREIGDVEKSSLKEIWNSEMMQLYRKKLLDNNYQNCCDDKCIAGIIPREQLSFDHWDNIA